jgi:hypothetical protein
MGFRIARCVACPSRIWRIGGGRCVAAVAIAHHSNALSDAPPVAECLCWYDARQCGASAQLFRSCVVRRPDNVEALIGSARADTVAGALPFVADPAAAFAAADAKLTKALPSVPDHARGHMTLGSVYIYIKRAARGLAECEHALARDRNLAQAHAFIGFGKITIGPPKRPRLTLSRRCA